MEKIYCNDCGTETIGQSKQFGFPLCRNCWEIRTGWSTIIEKAENGETEEAEALYQQKRGELV